MRNHSFEIRNIKIAPGLVLAPMSGVTNSAFRRLIRELNPGSVGLLVSEFVSVEGMTRNSGRSVQMMRFREVERPFAIQIFGYDIDRMRDGAKMVEDAGADIVDINCGCPAPKVVKRGGGCELMRQPEHLAKILREVRKAVKIPLTLKMRSGWEESALNASQVAEIAESEGVEALAVHGRTRTQLYRGLADWEVVEKVASERKIPVSGSGDVTDATSAAVRLRGSVAGLFIGRAALSNPFVFREICGAPVVSIAKSSELAVSILERYIELLREDDSPRASIGRVKQLASQMCRGLPWRQDVCRAMTLEDQQRILLRIKSGEWRPAHSQSLPSPTGVAMASALAE
jgi:tRNA-dihydrouridine synthase B